MLFILTALERELERVRVCWWVVGELGLAQGLGVSLRGACRERGRREWISSIRRDGGTVDEY